MKNALVYGFVFIVAFVGTTFGVFTMNSKFANMFEFDFRDAAEVALADSLVALDNLGLGLGDSVLVVNHEEKAKEFEEHYSEAKVELDKTTQELSKTEKEIESLKAKLEEKKSVEHEEWLLVTIKLYEAMEVGKAGELLKTLPEKEARELLYSMKNKKAAAILSTLDTETVKRLTRAKK